MEKCLHWFTSDWHLNHVGQTKYRPNVYDKDTPEENTKYMDEYILSNALASVPRGGNLYFLGDLAWKYKVEDYQKLFDRIKKAGINFHWIEGNHDKQFKHGAIKWRGAIKDIVIDHQSITLCHYPMRVWNKSHHNAWQLFGHIHFDDHTDNLIDYSNMGKQLNVNIEFHYYQPVSFDKLKEIMETKPDNFDLVKRG